MKKASIIVLSLLFLFIFFTGCDLDNLKPNDEKNVEFLALYVPYPDKPLGDKKKVMKLSVKDGVIDYSTFSDAYPSYSQFISSGDLKGGILTLGLESKSFESQGMYQILTEDEYHYLPLFPPEKDYRTSFFSESTPTLSENGFVLYISVTYDKGYGDNYKYFLTRYNTKDNTHQFAISPEKFALGQPEKGSDTETAFVKSNVFLSTDGNYAYGSIRAWGVDFGQVHIDYEILFSYSFDTQEYKRLGDEDDSVGMTNDRKWIVYNNFYKLKKVNIETGEVSFISQDINFGNVRENSWSNRGACVGGSSGNLYNKDIIADEEVIVCHVNNHPINTMFSKDEQHIYFTVDDGEKKYLCVTDGVGANSSYDTLGTYPMELYDLMLIK